MRSRIVTSSIAGKKGKRSSKEVISLKQVGKAEDGEKSDETGVQEGKLLSKLNPLSKLRGGGKSKAGSGDAETDQPGKASDQEKVESADLGPATYEDMTWWEGLSDLDNLNILRNPREDRARLLASKVSLGVEETIREISNRTGFPLAEDFLLADNPTKVMPLRLIHSFCCLPVKLPPSKSKQEAKPSILFLRRSGVGYEDHDAELSRHFEVIHASREQELFESLERESRIGVILLEFSSGEAGSVELLEAIKDANSEPALLLLAKGEEKEAAEEAVKNGLAEKSVFPRNPDPLPKANDLVAVIRQCLETYEKRRTKDFFEEADPDKVNLITVWPPTPRMSRWVFAVSGRRPVWHYGIPEKVVRSITENFGIGADSLEDSEFEEDAPEQEDDIEDQNAAIIRFVNEVIQRAIVDRATDIHFEPHKETLQIRYRIDGQLVPVRVPDNLRSFQDAIISRIKIMSQINISEKRRPQGGRITFSHGQSDLDVRVSTLPTLYGESISLRLLNEKSQPLSMRELGLHSLDERKIVSVLEKPHGIMLVTGPTGSGKSTSLTAFIRRIHKPERRIMTVEDPVEYEVSGVNQTQVNSEIGFTFASALREILRQDPDVIMVGEIRDRETADIAIRASLTGHLVLSTLHTNDAPGAITRLIDMEIEPFLIASSVEMVMAQRLVRRLCSSCAAEGMVSEDQLRTSLSLLEIDPTELIHADKVRSPVGCPKCQNLGFHGRVGIFELMRMSDEIHGMIIKSASAPEIREVALGEGMTTLQQSGWGQIKRGLTSLSEVIRYADIFVDEMEQQGDETS